MNTSFENNYNNYVRFIIANDKYIWSLLFADTHGTSIASVCARQFKSIFYIERQIIFDVQYKFIGFQIAAHFGAELRERSS